MATKYFAKDFQYCFYPLTSDGCDYELLPAAPDSIYLFDKFPTEAEAEAGTGAIEGPIAAWIDTDDARGKKISFSAVEEPDNLDNGFSKKYYVALNFELQTGVDLKPIIKEITLERLYSQDSIIEVEISDLLGQEPSLKLWSSCEGELDQYIDAAKKEVKQMLTGCEVDFRNILNPGQLNYPVTLLAISKAFFGQGRDPRGKEFFMGQKYAEDFNNSWKDIRLKIDKNNDGKVDGVKKKKSGFQTVRILR